MKIESRSRSYTYLYHAIIEELLVQICAHNEKYCVRRKIGNVDFPVALEHKFEEYKSKALDNMAGSRLDRHKLASCICGAIIEIKPITGVNGQKIGRAANEWLAMYVGVNVIKSYMIHKLLYKQGYLPKTMDAAKEYLKNNFEIKFPLNICDNRQYSENLVNALCQTHSVCKSTGKECFQYDIWAYSKIFYHLELHNQEPLKKAYQIYIQNNNV